MATSNRLARVRDRLQPNRRLHPPSVPWAPTEESPPRVLLECPPESSPAVVSGLLDRAGFDVIVCEGPTSHERCPMATGSPCAAVGAVDVVVNFLGRGNEARAEVLPALVASGPRRPAVVAMVGSDDTDVPEGAVTVDRRVGGTELVEAVHRALDSAQRPDGWWGD